MTRFSFSAPGKLFLLGEYAVLDGAPAFLRAVDRRVTVTLAESDSGSDANPGSGWSLTAPELGITTLPLGADAALPENIDGSLLRQLALFSAVSNTVNTIAPPTTAFAVTIESAQFLQDGHKLGLGSSAAVSVALTAALAASRGVTLSQRDLFTHAARAHSAAQGGRGSGGDVAASVYGGHILFRKDQEPRAMPWPESLDLFAVVTGTGSSTIDLVSRVAAYARRDQVQHRRDLDRLVALAGRTEAALGSADSFLRLAHDYFRAVQDLDVNAQAGIVTKRHLELQKIAATSGAVFKTSGAGGGDLGLVFAKLDRTDHPQSVFTEAGATVIPVPHSPDGVRREAA